jgi:hypothetical protein
MGRKITKYPNNVSVTPDELSLIDVSEKTGLATYESRKWTLSALTAWIKSKLGLSAGTLNKLSKFGADGTLVDSIIIDDGNGIGISTPPNVQAKAYLLSENRRIALMARSNYAGGNPAIGTVGVADGYNIGENIGGEFSADNSTVQNIGIRALASGSTAYLGQFSDGSEGIGKFIKSVTADGKANWAEITASNVKGIKYENNFSSGSWIGNTLTVNHNLNTDTPTVFCYINNELVSFQILTIDENSLSINKSDIIQAPSSIKIGITI